MLRKRNVFYYVYKRFFYFCHVFYVFDVFYFYLNVFTSMLPVSRMHFKNARPIQTRRRAHLSGPTHTTTPDTTKQSRLCRVWRNGVN